MNIKRDDLNRLLSLLKSECSLSFMRASGSGGQNVNKVSSKVELRWTVETSAFLAPIYKARFFHLFSNQINSEGELILTCQVSRNQSDNVSEVFKKFSKMIKASLQLPKVRVPTKPTYRAKQNRLKEKTKLSEKKVLRKKPVD